jgi:hypothetical protein
LLPAIAPAVDRYAARLDALGARGIDTAALRFEASHGRTSLEYYDGFVFSLHGPEGMAPVASGGRYDALRMRGCDHAVGRAEGARWARRGPRRATRWRLRRGERGRRDWGVAGGADADQPTNGTTSVRRALMMTTYRAKHTCAACHDGA